MRDTPPGYYCDAPDRGARYTRPGVSYRWYADRRARRRTSSRGELGDAAVVSADE